jgi:hypothetical protein
MQFIYLRLRTIILALGGIWICTGASAQVYYQWPESIPGGSLQLGAKVAYVKPRNGFAMEFKSAPSYELYLQIRSKHGNGPFSTRIGFFYTDTKPRLDTIPTYMVKVSYPDKLFPGYVVYHKMDLKGIYIDYAYSLICYNRLRLDLGLGLMGGISHVEYSRGYATLVAEEGNVADYIVGLRPRVNIGYQLIKYLEIYAEYMDNIVTSTDWGTQYSSHNFGLGLNFTFNPRSGNDD